MSSSPLVSMLMSIFSVIVPGKMWYTASQPIALKVDTKAATSLVMTTFDGKPIGAAVDVQADGKVPNLATAFKAVTEPGTYVLFAVPKGKTAADFVGTPVVVETRKNREPGAPGGVMVYHLVPLQYVQMKTSDGDLTMAFYYDAAPNTTENFERLAGEGFFDGVSFHRIIAGFVVQGGDPTGTGTGGPGFTIPEEFNDKPHEKGVLSMARQGSEGEQQGLPPDDRAKNSASSQFFICLDYAQTKALDNKYTAFGKVTDGMDAVDKLGKEPVTGDKPNNPPTIESAQLLPVTPGHNPYAAWGLGK